MFVGGSSTDPLFFPAVILIRLFPALVNRTQFLIFFLFFLSRPPGWKHVPSPLSIFSLQTSTELPTSFFFFYTVCSRQDMNGRYNTSTFCRKHTERGGKECSTVTPSAEVDAAKHRRLCERDSWNSRAASHCSTI